MISTTTRPLPRYFGRVALNFVSLCNVMALGDRGLIPTLMPSPNIEERAA